MQYKGDIECGIVADLGKPSASKRYWAAIYTLTALSSIVLGALAMALLYHWNELQVADKRLEAQDVKEVIRLTDVLLTKHETNAANVEKLLTLFEHKLQSIESNLQPKTDGRYEYNLTYDNQKGNRQDGNKRAELLGSTVSPSEVKTSKRVEALTTEQPVASIATQSARSGSDETKQPEPAPHDENQSSESFHWELSFPQSAWLKLSSFGINYGTASDDVVASEETAINGK